MNQIDVYVKKVISVEKRSINWKTEQFPDGSAWVVKYVADSWGAQSYEEEWFSSEEEAMSIKVGDQFLK